MLLRLAVLRRRVGVGGSVGTTEGKTHSVQLVAKLLLEGKLPSIASCSMGWCILCNAMGSTKSPNSIVFAGTDNYKLIQVINRALHECDSSMDGTLFPLRQSTGAFLYNTSRHFTINKEGDGDIKGAGNARLSKEQMANLLGSLQHLQDKIDVICLQRLLMATGELLKLHKFGKTVASLVNE